MLIFFFGLLLVLLYGCMGGCSRRTNLSNTFTLHYFTEIRHVQRDVCENEDSSRDSLDNQIMIHR